MIVRFDCEACGDTCTSTGDTWLIRGVGDQVAMRCRNCGRLVVADLDPATCRTLMDIGVLVIGVAELELLREFEDPNPPTAC